MGAVDRAGVGLGTVSESGLRGRPAKARGAESLEKRFSNVV